MSEEKSQKVEVKLHESVVIMQSKPLDLNTHSYDGSIGLLYNQLVEKDKNENEKLLSFEESINLIKEWLKESKLEQTFKDKTQRTIDLLLTDKNGNYDSANKIHVEELLPRVVNIVSLFETSGKDCFLQSLSEITELGSCSQGRTTRLLGFYISYRT